ncbi:Cell division protein ZipA [Marinobacter nitratireducens]|uniref:Cell division protein ZipA n=1 Tax=Marinobacter nitratireducens TaxID=1137280 RepID=A0A072NHC8_9GAMM|nr:cell division protein ZipA [Marinobacter nitratireducens]KEF32535.1 Cell division protein ZipA [Marinobacter nitratireducens]
MSLREWLIAIGTLVIIGIVIDGVRRMRRARKESMAISSGMGADDLAESPLDEDYNPELPNGGARTVSREILEERGYVRAEKPVRVATSSPKPTRPVKQSREDDFVAADPVTTGDDDLDGGFSSHDEPVPELESGWSATEEVAAQEPAQEDPPEMESPKAPEAVSGPSPTRDVQEDTASRDSEPRKDQPLAGANRPEAREVIVINVLAPAEQEYKGPALKKLFEACGLEFGDMDIYHRHEASDTTSPVQFSVASAVEPGTFRQSDIDTLSTPGISFFMSMPGPTSALQAFEFMLETAQCVVRNLGGELKDERRSVMTGQTIEHCRQRIREFERKQRFHQV